MNEENKPTIIVLLDHVLDCTTGLEVFIKAKITQLKFSIEMIWVLLSGIEDQDIINS